MAWEPWDDDGDEGYRSYFPPSRPLPAKGGIKARSQRGAFAAKWWGQRWIAALEAFGLGTRLTRGRSYARKGQVLQLEITPGVVSATVQGSRANPYAVRISLKQIDRAQRRKLGDALGADLSTAARMIGGELPPEVEQCFARAGAPLFPQIRNDLVTRCSCPDSSNPCKHIAAVYYILAEEFDRDPFLLLALRGVSRDQFVALLGDRSGAPSPAPGSAAASEAAAAQPLSADPRRFWRGAQIPDQRYGEAALGDEAAPIARRLGAFPFWRGETDFLEEIGRLSRDAAARAIKVLTAAANQSLPSEQRR
ncbi:MAG: SWIM zinc finger family protein [Candidatus Binataceae bacterium]